MKSKAPLVLMEQIIMLLVFALASAICLQAFVRADVMSAESAARDRAAILAQSTAELVRSYQGDMAKAAEQLNAKNAQGTLEQNYDENLLPITEGAPTYVLQAFTIPSNTPGVGAARVQVLNAELQTLFDIDIAWQEVAADV